MSDNIHPQVVCFGEVLWDLLPGGAAPGGAPMNVAYHLHQQGIETAVISRVGADEAGTKLLDVFKEKGIGSEYFQLDESHETGKVYASQNEQKDMTYEIVQPVAWDFIEWENRFEPLVAQAAYFVFGSLAARSPVSAATLFKLLEYAPQKVLDINLRAPHFKKELLLQLLQKTDILKMNFEELELVSGWFAAYPSVEDRIRFISERYQIPDVIITKGKDGAMLYRQGQFYNHGGYAVDVADTVGSGDALLAGFLASLLQHKPAAEALEWGSRMGAYVATRTGACPAYTALDVYRLTTAGS